MRRGKKYCTLWNDSNQCPETSCCWPRTEIFHQRATNSNLSPNLGMQVYTKHIPSLPPESYSINNITPSLIYFVQRCIGSMYHSIAFSIFTCRWLLLPQYTEQWKKKKRKKERKEICLKVNNQVFTITRRICKIETS